MSIVQTIALQRTGTAQISVIAPQAWDAFCRGGAPLRACDGKVDLMLLTWRDGVCAEIDPVSLSVDESGYLIRIELGLLQPLPNDPTVLDARAVFLRRYLTHTHRWVPSEQLIHAALAAAELAIRT